MIAVGDNPGEATPEQIEEMKRLLRQGLDDGALGMSLSSTYTPGMYASEDELTALCEVLVEKRVWDFGNTMYMPYFSTHTRNYVGTAMRAYEEMLRISAKSNAPVHLTHAVLNFPPNVGRAPEFLKMLEEKLDEGVDITLDTYPYLPGSTTLVALLPSWATAGGPNATLKRLRDRDEPGTLEKIKQNVLVDGSDECHGETID
jgi:N-acyl-D-amino-acid deacylase